MMIVDGRVHATTPARVIEVIDYRLEVLANGFPDGENGLEVRRLKGGRERWTPRFPAVLSGPWSKMDTQLAKLALILAVTRSADEDSAREYVSGYDMRSALRLLEYFKATTRKVYGQLFEVDPDDVLAHDLATLLADTGYVYQGTISNLRHVCSSEAMPDPPRLSARRSGA